MTLLDGIRVLEFGMLLNADSVGMRLGDLGADVIKVESPPIGDYLRDINGTIVPRHSPMHLQANKNKRSIGLDMRSPGARDVFWRLFDTADVFVDGFLVGAVDKLGIGYDVQRARKPGIVYCSHTGFGTSGPYARVPTHGQMMDALGAALPRVMGDDGLLHAPPMNGHLGTMAGGEGTSAGAAHAVMHILAGLVHRMRTGEGCYIDVAASDAVVGQAWINVATGANAHRVTDNPTATPVDNGAMTGAKYQHYRCADGRNVLFCAIEHKFWDAFCTLVERPDLIEHKNTATPVDYGVDPWLRAELQTIFATRTVAEWMDLAIANKLPIGPSPIDVDEMRRDPHVQHRGLLFEADHPVAGTFTYAGASALVRDHPYELRHHAPTFGQHTDEILDELGFGDAVRDELRRTGTVA